MNDKEAKVVSNGGISFFSLLTIVFIVLKLTHYIDWSWWLVLAPLWIPAVIIIGMIIFVAYVISKIKLTITEDKCISR